MTACGIEIVGGSAFGQRLYLWPWIGKQEVEEKWAIYFPRRRIFKHEGRAGVNKDRVGNSETRVDNKQPMFEGLGSYRCLDEGPSTSNGD